MIEENPPETQPVTQRRGREEEVKLAQLIVFHLGDEEFAAKIAEVREIIKTGAITPIPDAPEFIKGIINVRGDIVVTIDPKVLLSLNQGDIKQRAYASVEGEARSGPAGRGGDASPHEGVSCKHVIITEQEKNIFGLMVDEVTEVMRVPESEIKAPPELLTALREDYVRGVVTLENRLIILLDLSRVLSDDELERLSETQRMQYQVASHEGNPEGHKKKRVKKGVQGEEMSHA